MNKNTCCEKCFKEDSTGIPRVGLCRDIRCSCHLRPATSEVSFLAKPLIVETVQNPLQEEPQEGWEEEFSKLFDNQDKFSSRSPINEKYMNGYIGRLLPDIKDFIRGVAKKAREEGYEEGKRSVVFTVNETKAWCRKCLEQNGPGGIIYPADTCVQHINSEGTASPILPGNETA